MRPKPLIAGAGPMKTDGRITELHLWAVHEGLRRTPTAILFEDFCRRLVAAGVPLWRFCRNANLTSAVGWLHLHLVARPQRDQPGPATPRRRTNCSSVPVMPMSYELTTAWRRGAGKEDVVPDAPRPSGNDAMPVSDIETAYRLYAEEISQAWKTPR